MAMRAVAQRLGAKHAPFPRVLGRRAFSEGSGKVLGEEERAAENMYIKKMEKEKLEKLAQKGAKHEEQGGSGSSYDSTPGVEPATDNSKNIAVLAGVVAVVAAGWWYFRSQPKAKEEKD